jgi:hypothetical protein
LNTTPLAESNRQCIESCVNSGVNIFNLAVG